MKLRSPCTWLHRALLGIGMGLIMGVSMTACGYGEASWKEEVLLHDGTKLIVQRSQTRGGRHEIGQEVPIAEHSISFLLPGADKQIYWKSDFGMEIEKSNLSLLALDVLAGVPYVVTTPNRCHAYNQWGRPNPPYVILKFDGEIWSRIPLAQFPTEIRQANVVIDNQEFERRLTAHSGVVLADDVKRINAEGRSPDVSHLRVFAREPIKVAQTKCPDYSSPRYSSPKAPLPIPPSDQTNDPK